MPRPHPNQLNLLDSTPPVTPPVTPRTPAEVQADHLRRVSERIGGEIVAFCRDRLARGAPEFVMSELQTHVAARIPNTAPDSPSRVFRSLKARGVVTYDLVSRHDSRYRIVAVANDAPKGPCHEGP